MKADLTMSHTPRDLGDSAMIVDLTSYVTIRRNNSRTKLKSMSTPEEHRSFLARKTYEFGIIDFSSFSRDELATLNRYGTWLEALATGVISPITKEQLNFVEFVKGSRGPRTDFERAWSKLLRVRSREGDPGFQPAQQLNEGYRLCPVCNKRQVLGGKTCVQCRIESGQLNGDPNNHVCPVCHSTVLSSGKALVCSACTTRSRVSRRHLGN